MLLEHVNMQPQLISLCSENRLNPTVILLLPVYSQAVGRHLCPGEVSVSPHPARRQRPTERPHSLPQKPHLQQSHSHVSVCGLHACARTLGRERLKVCVPLCFSEWHSGALRQRCVWIPKHRWEDSWSTAGRGERHQQFHLWWSTPGSLNQYWSVKPFLKSWTCVCVCVRFPELISWVGMLSSAWGSRGGMQDRVSGQARAPHRGAGVTAGNPHLPDCPAAIPMLSRSSSSGLILNWGLSPGGLVSMLHL